MYLMAFHMPSHYEAVCSKMLPLIYITLLNLLYVYTTNPPSDYIFIAALHSYDLQNSIEILYCRG
jgi:hypothetical protein